MPWLRSRRQLTRCEEYKPSRRRSAPTPPGVAAALSASCRMRCLYSAVKVRRLALATNSGSGGDADVGTEPASAAAALLCRVGTAGCPAAPLTEPDLRATHPALWIVNSKRQTKLVRDFCWRVRNAPEVV